MHHLTKKNEETINNNRHQYILCNDICRSGYNSQFVHTNQIYPDNPSITCYNPTSEKPHEDAAWNLDRRPYFILALAGSLLYLGITNLILFPHTLATMPPLIDYSQPYILDQLILSLTVSIVELSVGGILLYRSLVIRKLIKK